MASEIVDRLRDIVSDRRVLTGDDAAPWSQDWSGQRRWTPLAVAQPSCAEEVAAIVRLANDSATPVVPVAGNTGITSATMAEGAIMVSLARMSAIREIRAEARVAVVEAGVILSALHDAADAHGLVFPLTFGARGSAMIGGCLSTNAGGSNVVRYGNTRDLCLGIEAVTPTGEVLDLMSALRKDNSGYDLRDLLIGAEGTLGIVTAAAVRLFAKPRAYATAMAACSGVGAALGLLNILQSETGGAVEAFEYMPAEYVDAHLKRFPDARPPFERRHDVNILIEIGALSAREADPGPDGKAPVSALLEDVLAKQLKGGAVLDAVVAQSEAQRREMWARREAAAEVARLHEPLIDGDVAVPLDSMETLLERIDERATALDPGIRFLNVAHLGDGNLHFAAWPETPDPQVHAQIREAVVEETVALGGSFSAEHGVGLSKLSAMSRHKDPVALSVMRAIKTALDPNNVMNPGKVLPPAAAPG